MTRRLGGNGRRSLAVLATVSLAAALACGGTVVGCGSSSGSNNPQTDSGIGGDTGTNHTDGGNDTGSPDTGSPDTGIIIDSGTPDTFVLPACPTPVLAPTPPAADPGDVTITDPGLASTASIYYTTDLTNPTTSSPVYSGPIQISQNTTIRAMAQGPTCAESPVVSGVYTVTPFDGGGLPPVTFETLSSVAHNDFLLGLSDSPAPGSPTICYTEDTTVPTCTAGACTGTSQTYQAANRVPINGTVTDVTTGQVTVHAIACEAGYANSADQFQVYTLQSADPTVAGIVAGDQAYNANGLSVSVSTTTQTSINPPNNSNIGVSTTGAPLCVQGPTGKPTPVFPTVPQTNGQLQAQACKSGYLSSNVVTLNYTFTLNQPSITGGTFFARPTLSVGPPAGPAVVVDGANGSADALCATITGAAPTCAAAGGCGAAPTQALATATIKPGNATSATTNIQVVACPAAPGINQSATANANFTLQLSQPFLSTNDPDTSSGPGWDNQTDGLPVTGFNIPNSYAGVAGYPYGDTCGANPCVWDASQVQGPTATCDEFDATGNCTKYFGANFYCWSVTGTAACNCAAANQVTAGAAPVQTAALPAGAATASGKTLSLISCQTPAAAIVWAPSAVTNVAVSGANQATAPAISTPTSSPYLTQATATITNQDPLTSAICYTYASPAVTPTCTAAGACNTVCPPTNATCAGISLGGKGDGATPPDNVYTINAGSSDGTGVGATTYASGANKASATNLPGLLQQNGFTLSAVACNGTKTASTAATQVYDFSMDVPHVSSLAAYTSGSYGDLDNPTTIGAGTAIYLNDTSNYDITAAGFAPIVAYATGATVNCGGTNAALQKVTIPNGTSLVDVWDNGAHPPVQLPNQLAAPTTGTSWELTFMGCGQTTTDQLSSAPKTITYSLASSTPLITTNQDPAVNLGLDAESGACSTTKATCGLGGQPPCCTCAKTAADATADGLPLCCSSVGPAGQIDGAPGTTQSCAPASTWENTFTVSITSATPGASLCVSTVAAPTCNNGTCVGATNQASPVTLPIGNTPTTVYALGCTANLPQSTAATQFTFNLNSTPAVLVPSGAGSCAANPFIELATDPANRSPANPVPSPGDTAQAGPSVNTCLCYTTDGNPTGTCNPATCAPQVGSTATCFTAFNGTYHQKQLTLSTTTTINAVTCSANFAPTSSPLTFSTAPYRDTITVDGSLTDWDHNTWGTTFTTGVEDGNVNEIDEFNGTGHQSDTNLTDSLFTYDNTNLYFAFADTTGGGSFPWAGHCCNQAGNSCQGGACYPAAASDLVIYIGNGVAGGALTDLPSLHPGQFEATRKLPAGAGIRYAFVWNTGTATAPTTWVWTPGAPGSWGTPGGFAVAVGYGASTGNVEFSVPWTSVGVTATSTVTVLGAIVSDVGAAGPLPSNEGSHNLFGWPVGIWNTFTVQGECSGAYANYWNSNMASCSTPLSQQVLGTCAP